MTAKGSQLAQIIAPAVEAMGFEFVGCELHRHHYRSLLRIFIDGPSGVTLDDCAKVSRQVSATLDVEDPVQGRYLLEVSSPGLERPLFTAEHYRRFLGRCVSVRLRVPEEGRRQYRGIVEAVEGERITLKVDNLTRVISLSEIEKANLIADFDKR